MTETTGFEEEPEQGLWEVCLEYLSMEIPAQQFASWIRPLRAQVSDGADAVSLQAPNRFAQDFVRKQYLGRITELLEEINGQPVVVELALAPRSQSRVAMAAAPVPAALAPNPANGELQEPQEVYAPGNTAARIAKAQAASARLAAQTQSARQRSDPADDEAAGEPGVAALTASVPADSTQRVTRLNPSFTFDTLIEGTANRMARAAAMQVAHSPGMGYNPLFIYGGVGLGKTHLMHAVGNQLLAERPDARVLYIHAEQFVTDVVNSYQRKTYDHLKKHYHSLDLLLIDDVQFFAGKEKTQEEFFNAFEALLRNQSHIVMTSDTYPKGLKDIHERLVSRFDAGLTVAIEPPELEMRVAILINKARMEAITLSEDVAFFIAKNVRSNVRELEGALRKVLAYARFNNKEISILVAREALRDLLSIQNRQISVENIQKTVADFYKIKVADMYSKKRPASIAKPRQVAMYLSKELTQKSLPELGELFGGRDHTTVLHAVRKIAQERQQNTELNQQLHVLEQTLKR